MFSVILHPLQDVLGHILLRLSKSELVVYPVELMSLLPFTVLPS